MNRAVKLSPFTAARLFAGLLALGVSAAAIAEGAKPPLVQAAAALQAGEADKALAMLKPLESGAGSAAAHNLDCRVLFTLEHWDGAVAECEKAVDLDPQNSDYHMWLGRALGEKANRATFLNAYSLGKRVRSEFEAAVRLNPRNAEAMADLAEFYYSAPGIVGGGIDKADKLAVQMDKIDAVRAHELRGRIAIQRKDYGTAEREFKQALAVSSHPAFQWVTLAAFYRKRQQWTEMENAIRACAKAGEHDPHAGVALYDAASILTATNRDPGLAAKLLETYLAGPIKTEEAPATVAHTRLARLMAQRGDAAGAKREQTAALALAHDYRPAQDLAVQETKH